MTLVDQNSTEIRATFFQAGVDRFFEMLALGRVYLFSNGRVKVANTQYSSVKNDQEISFDEKAVVVECAEDQSIAKAVFNFIKIAGIEAVEPLKLIDTIGVVAVALDAVNITSKASGKDLVKRDVTLADDSGASISLTLWGDKTQLELKTGDVLALKGVKVADYGGRSLSNFGSTVIEVNPAIKEAQALAAWWPMAQGSGFRALTESGRGGGGAGGAGGGEGPTTVVEARFTVSLLKSDAAAGNDGPVHMVKATLYNIKNDDPSRLWYPACPQVGENGRACQKKMTSDSDGGAWTCPKGCYGQVPNYRYIANSTLCDWSGQEYATLFDAEAQEVLGVSANDLHAMVAGAGGDVAGLPQNALMHFSDALFREYLFTTKAKQEERAGEQRVQVTVVKVRGRPRAATGPARCSRHCPLPAAYLPSPPPPSPLDPQARRRQGEQGAHQLAESLPGALRGRTPPPAHEQSLPFLCCLSISPPLSSLPPFPSDGPRCVVISLLLINESRESTRGRERTRERRERKRSERPLALDQ